jgi:tetratricopeptide (TPR) repeat protein
MSFRIYFLAVSFIFAFCSTTAFAQETACENFASNGSDAWQLKHDAAAAESLFLAALSYKSGCSDETLLVITTNLGAMYANQKRFYEAERLFREALTLAAKVKGAKHRDFPFYISNLAIACGNIGKTEEAESFFKMAISRAEETWDENGRLARLLEIFAGFLRKENRIIEADAIDKRAQDILKKPNSHPILIEVETEQN